MYSSHSFENEQDISLFFFQAEGQAVLAGRLVHTQNIPVEVTVAWVIAVTMHRVQCWAEPWGGSGGYSVCLSSLVPGASHSGSKHNPAAARTQDGAAAHPHPQDRDPHTVPVTFSKPSILPSLSSGKKPLGEEWLFHLPSGSGN